MTGAWPVSDSMWMPSMLKYVPIAASTCFESSAGTRSKPTFTLFTSSSDRPWLWRIVSRIASSNGSPATPIVAPSTVSGPCTFESASAISELSGWGTSEPTAVTGRPSWAA